MEVKRAVIPAAGLGTRFLPATKAMPKPMLTIFDKPIIQYIAEELENTGIEEIIIVVSPNSDIIKNHFTPNKDLEDRLISDGKKSLYEIAKKTSSFNVKFVVQETANGLAGAILSAEKYIKDEPFALLLGDELILPEKNEKTCIQKLLGVFEKTGKSTLATMEVFGDDVSKYGNLGVSSEDGEIINVNNVVEKPSVNDALSNYAIIGRYVLSGEVVGKLKTLKPRNNEIYLTDVLCELGMNNKLVATTFSGERFDAGDKLGFIKAGVTVALNSEEAGSEVKKYIKDLASKL